MIKKYTKNNFFKHTFCDWKLANEVPKPKADYISTSGSHYFFTEDGVYRIANHWGRAANCRWRLLSSNKASQYNQIGFANWTDFYPNNDTDLLYFIEIDWNTRKVRYQHKFADKKTGTLYRSALITAKRIQLIHTILENTTWAKYIDYEDLEELTHFVVNRLINTNESMLQIKQAWVDGEEE